MKFEYSLNEIDKVAKDLINCFENKIVLFNGKMGSGKTTIGKILSKNLKLNFVDTDILLEKEYGLKITKIFENTRTNRPN